MDLEKSPKPYKGGVENSPKFNAPFSFLSKFFFIFIYPKQVYILKACVRLNFTQYLIAAEARIRYPGWKNFEKLISVGDVFEAPKSTLIDDIIFQFLLMSAKMISGL